MSIKPNSNIIFSNLNINTKSKKSRARNMKYFEKKRKPIPFLEDLWRDCDENEGFLERTRWVWKGKERTRHWTVTISEGKMKIFFENCPENNPQSAKHTFFVTGMSRKQVTKSSCQKPVWQILKNLSKYFSQLEGPLVSKSRNSLSKLATRASTRESVAKTELRKC